MRSVDTRRLAKARLAAARMLRDTGISGDEDNNLRNGYNLLAELFGYANGVMLAASRKHLEELEAMGGPNGYTVYKMLLARKGEVS